MPLDEEKVLKLLESVTELKTLVEEGFKNNDNQFDYLKSELKTNIKSVEERIDRHDDELLHIKTDIAELWRTMRPNNWKLIGAVLTGISIPIILAIITMKVLP